MVQPPDSTRFPGLSWVQTLLGSLPAWPYALLMLVGMCVLGGALSYMMHALPREMAESATASALAAEEQQLLNTGTELLNATFSGELPGLDIRPQQGSSASVEKGFYRASFSAAGNRFLILTPSVENFIAELDCILLEGSDGGECGIIFACQTGEADLVGDAKRTAATGGDADRYTLLITGNTYEFQTQIEKSTTTLGKSSSAILSGSGRHNRLRVVRLQEDIRLYVNGILVARLRDHRLGAGGVGFHTGSRSTGENVQVALDSFRVWQIP